MRCLLGCSAHMIEPAGWLTCSLLTAAGHQDALTAQQGLCRIQLNFCFHQFTYSSIQLVQWPVNIPAVIVSHILQALVQAQIEHKTEKLSEGVFAKQNRAREGL